MGWRGSPSSSRQWPGVSELSDIVAVSRGGGPSGPRTRGTLMTPLALQAPGGQDLPTSLLPDSREKKKIQALEDIRESTKCK